MNINREAIYQALFSAVAAIQINGSAVFVTSSRRLQPWNKVPAISQPALFQAETRQVPAANPRIRTRWELYSELYVYVNTGDDPNAVPSSQLNPILDAIDQMFPEQAGALNNLGIANIYDARISGTVEIYENVLAAQSVALIPIRIIAT